MPFLFLPWEKHQIKEKNMNIGNERGEVRKGKKNLYFNVFILFINILIKKKKNILKDSLYQCIIL